MTHTDAYICDGCGTKSMAEGSGMPKRWVHIQVSGWADREFDLCDTCKEPITQLTNAADARRKKRREA